MFPERFRGFQVVVRTIDAIRERASFTVDRVLELHARKALVFDESHYCKNPKARRTKALIHLSEQLAPDTLRLALTGTPLVKPRNAPASCAGSICRPHWLPAAPPGSGWPAS